jgi:hypothetical protein
MISLFVPFAFVDDVLLFYDVSRRDARNLKEILELYYTTISMLVNVHKYCITFNGVEEDQIRVFLLIFPHYINIQVGFIYLHFFLKPMLVGLMIRNGSYID